MSNSKICKFKTSFKLKNKHEELCFITFYKILNCLLVQQDCSFKREYCDSSKKFLWFGFISVGFTATPYTFRKNMGRGSKGGKKGWET
jgi:hypothetical protein